MDTKSLKSWFLIIGPLMVLISFIFWPTVDTATEELLELSKNPLQSQIIMSLFVLGMILIFTGLSMASKIISEIKSSFSGLATASTIIFPMIIPAILTGVGINMAAVDLYEKSEENANSIYLVAYYMVDGVQFAMFLGFLLLGISMIKAFENTTGKILAVLYILVGIFHLIGAFDPNAAEAVDFIAWLGMFLVTLGFGVIALLDKLSARD